MRAFGSLAIFLFADLTIGLSVAKAPAKNLLENPGFESGALAPWVQLTDLGDPIVNKNGNGLPGAETPYGNYFLMDLVATTAPSVFGQPLTLHRGRNYTISYALKVLLFSASTANFSTSYAGEQIDQVQITSADYDWTNYTSTFKTCEHSGNFTFSFSVEGNDASVILGIDAFNLSATRT